MDRSKEVVVFRCIHSDGVQYDEARFPSDHKLADEATVRSYCDSLGAMIAEQVYPGALQSFTLEALPPSYQLRVRARTDSKTHNDTFLYGYPEYDDEKEKKKTKKQAALKCYRSPAEFFDHLLWLITDATKDGKNCYCKLCKPFSVFRQKTQEKTQEASESNQPKAGPVPARLTGKARSASPAPSTNTRTSSKKTSAAASTAKDVSVPPVPQEQPSVQPVAKPAVQPAVQPTTHLAPQPPTQLQPPAQPTAQPAMQIQTRVQTQSDESVLFREGEVVWYRKMGATFRLGIVLQSTPGGTAVTPANAAVSIIKPLAHFQTDLEVVERSDADMRPFLTYSVPKVQDKLQDFADQPMERVSWLVLESELPYDETQRAEILVLEASKIAASRVDHSYSLFNPIHNPNFPPNQLGFGGVFFGCEKIGIFEAVRVAVEPDEHPQWDNIDVTFIMVLKGIILERSEQGERLLFGGDVWVLQESKDPEQAPNQDQVPPAMRREREFRNGVAKNYGYRFDWVLLRGNVMKTEKSIKGRFYESQKLGPMLYQEPTWSDYLRDGYIPSIQKSLNKRLDSWGPTIGRVLTRRDAVAGAIPNETPLSLGPRVIEPSRTT